MPAMPINSPWEMPSHLRTISTLRVAAGSLAVSFVELENREPNAQVFATQPVVFFAIITGIAQQAVQLHATGALLDCVRKLNVIVARTLGRDYSNPKITAGITNGCQFREIIPRKTFISTALDIITADMMVFKASRINSAFRLLGDYSTFASMSKNGLLELFKSPFFNNLAWVFCNVV